MLVLASNQPDQFDWAINDRLDDLIQFVEARVEGKEPEEEEEEEEEEEMEEPEEPPRDEL